MIKRILEQEKAIVKVLSEDRNSLSLIPSGNQITILEDVVKALEKVSLLTDLLSGMF